MLVENLNLFFLLQKNTTKIFLCKFVCFCVCFVVFVDADEGCDFRVPIRADDFYHLRLRSYRFHQHSSTCYFSHLDAFSNRNFTVLLLFCIYFVVKGVVASRFASGGNSYGKWLSEHGLLKGVRAGRVCHVHAGTKTPSC